MKRPRGATRLYASNYEEIILTKEEIWYDSKKKREPIKKIPLHAINSIEVEDGEAASSRVTATRLVTLGVFALTAKKKSGGDKWLSIEGDDCLIMMHFTRKDVPDLMRFVAKARVAAKEAKAAHKSAEATSTSAAPTATTDEHTADDRPVRTQPDAEEPPQPRPRTQEKTQRANLLARFIPSRGNPTPSEPRPDPAPQQQRKPFYKRWWFIAVVAVIALAALGKALGVKGTTPTTAGQSASAPAATATTEAAPTAAPTAEATQDVPREHKNALEKAKSYSKTMHMSKQGIYNQLTSKIEGFDAEAAQYAVDNLDADYNANALAKAKEYANNLHMSSDAIRTQLTSQIDGFTEDEADYAVAHLDD